MEEYAGGFFNVCLSLSTPVFVVGVPDLLVPFNHCNATFTPCICYSPFTSKGCKNSIEKLINLNWENVAWGNTLAWKNGEPGTIFHSMLRASHGPMLLAQSFAALVYGQPMAGLARFSGVVFGRQTWSLQSGPPAQHIYSPWHIHPQRFSPTQPSLALLAGMVQLLVCVVLFLISFVVTTWEAVLAVDWIHLLKIGSEWPLTQSH